MFNPVALRMAKLHCFGHSECYGLSHKHLRYVCLQLKINTYKIMKTNTMRLFMTYARFRITVITRINKSRSLFHCKGKCKIWVF